MQSSQKNQIKQSLTIEQVEDFVAELGGEPINKGNQLVCRTVCHCGNSHKLFYYDNTKLFKCYTECDDTFDIYDLFLKHQEASGHKLGYYDYNGDYAERDWNLYDSINYVCKYFKIEFTSDTEEGFNINAAQQVNIKQKIENLRTPPPIKNPDLVEYENVIKNYPQPHIYDWEKEGITYEVLLTFGIKYNPVSGGVLIPHYDRQGRLIGIRERTLIDFNAETYGKYRPAYIGKKLYNHPLGFNLYNLNRTWKNIYKQKLVIVGEGEKFCMMYSSFFGADNDITVACCGSSLIAYQVQILLSLHVQEIVIAFDKQFQQRGDEEFKRWTKKLRNIHQKYCHYVTISFMFDKKDRLDYKDSPIDKGKDIFLQLFQERIFL